MPAAVQRYDYRQSERVRPSRNDTATSGTSFLHYLRRPLQQAATIAFSVTVLATLLIAWLQKDEGYLTAETGVGYWLGIVGVSMMGLLIAYPLRKRIKALQGLGRMSGWFRLHMILGILGPTAIILHSNFKLGSINSQLALFTMLIVVFSGIVGRYLYAKVHKGLYGRHATVREIVSDLGAMRDQLAAFLGADSQLVAELDKYASSEVAAGAETADGRRARRRARGLVAKEIATISRAERWSRRDRRQLTKAVTDGLDLYFAAVQKARRLAVYDRLFGLWHHLHFPLFLLLAFTVTIHVIAVHLY